jgi:hypothetical protein
MTVQPEACNERDDYIYYLSHGPRRSKYVRRSLKHRIAMFVPKRVVELRLDVSPFLSQSLAGSDVRAVRRISGTGLRTFWLFGSKLGRRPRS